MGSGVACVAGRARLPLPLLLGRRERLLEVVAHRARRRLWRGDRDFWLTLETHWRPTILSCWLQNRYLPYVTGSTIMRFDPEAGRRVDPLRAEVRRFDPPRLLAEMGFNEESIWN